MRWSQNQQVTPNSILKLTVIYYLIASEVQGLRCGLAAWFWLILSHVAAVRHWAGLQWSRREAEPLPSNGCCLLVGDLFLSMWDSGGAGWVFSCHGCWLPPGQTIQEIRAEAPWLYGSASQVTHQHLCSIQTDQSRFNVGGDSTKEKSKRWGLLPAILEAGYLRLLVCISNLNAQVTPLAFLPKAIPPAVFSIPSNGKAFFLVFGPEHMASSWTLSSHPIPIWSDLWAHPVHSTFKYIQILATPAFQPSPSQRSFFWDDFNTLVTASSLAPFQSVFKLDHDM